MSKNEKFWSGVVGLAGALIGGVLVASSTILIHSWEQADIRNSTRSAFHGDIEAQLHIEEQREKHLTGLYETLLTTSTCTEADEKGRPWLIPKEPREDYIFVENARNLGTLNLPIPSHLAQYYRLLGSMRAQLEILYGRNICNAGNDDIEWVIKLHESTRAEWHGLAAELLEYLED